MRREEMRCYPKKKWISFHIHFSRTPLSLLSGYNFTHVVFNGGLNSLPLAQQIRVRTLYVFVMSSSSVLVIMGQTF